MKIVIELDGKEPDTVIENLTRGLYTMYRIEPIDHATLQQGDLKVSGPAHLVFNKEELKEPEQQPDPMAGFIPPPPGGAAPLVDFGAVGFGADAAASSTAPVVPSGTSTQTTAPLVPAPPTGDAGTAPASNAAPTDPAAKDSKGMSWDERIHSESRATNKDGTWRYRRNLADAVKHQVEMELRGGPAPASLPAAPGNEPPPLPAGVTASAPPPPSATAADSTPFSRLMKQLSPHINSPSNPTGRLTQQTIVDCAALVGVNGVIGLRDATDAQIRDFMGHINAALGG